MTETQATYAARPQVLTGTKGMGRDDWLRWRRRGIGGSDAAAVCGCSPWRTALEVYLEKTGEAEVVDGEAVSAAALWGSLLETPVADYYASCHPEQTIRRRHAILQSESHPFMLANLDRFIFCPARGRGVLEVKTGGAHRAGDWGENAVPDYYLLQMQHYLAVTGCDYGVFAVLLGGQTYVEREVARDDQLIADLIEIESAFWTRVERRDPPPLDGTPASGQWLKDHHARADDGVTVDLPGDALPLIEAYEAHGAAAKEQQKLSDAAKNQLCQLLGDAERGTVGGREVTWRNVARTGYSVPDSTYRKFSVK